MSVSTWIFEPGTSAQHLVDAIRSEHAGRPFAAAVVLGSGWSGLLPGDELLGRYAYADWDCFSAVPIRGQAGHLDVVRHGESCLLVFNGRLHCYQGLSAHAVSLPVRLAAALGCRHLLLTCAAGGITPDLAPGDYLLVTDHINLLGDNPLRGLEPPAFIDLSHLYQHQFAAELQSRCRAEDVRVRTGILAAMPGPSYETPAEIRMLARCGADVVSMSIVAEAIMAGYLGMPVAALALVANPAAGLDEAALDHTEVLAAGQRARLNSSLLLQALMAVWPGVAGPGD